MLLIYVFLVLHSVLGHHYPRKEKIFYNIEDAKFHFEWFMETHNITYSSEMEKALRFVIFQQNIREINELNRKDPHCVFAINRFADLTSEEFVDKYTGLRPDLVNSSDACNMITDIETRDAPPAFDWRDHIEMQVKNQLTCESCWAFSATGNVEAQYYLRYKTSISLSEQQIVDCDQNNKGCDGGIPAIAMRYLIQSGGQEPENVYPYVNRKDECKFSPGKARVRVTDCNSFSLDHEDLIKEVLFKYGPLSAAVDATSFNTYHGGIIGNCIHEKLNHAVMIVGYGKDEVLGKDYWIIKNSWGPTWGEDGFVRIQRGVNACGILNNLIASAIIE